MNKPTAYLDWSLYAQCPKCGEEFNLVHQDEEGWWAGNIFNNTWDALKDNDVTCEHCQHDFVISGVEY